MPLSNLESTCDYKCGALAPLVHPGGGPFAAVLVLAGLTLHGIKDSTPKVAQYCLKFFLRKFSEVRYGEQDIMRRAVWTREMDTLKIKRHTKTLLLCCISLLSCFGYFYIMYRNFPACKARCLSSHNN